MMKSVLCLAALVAATEETLNGMNVTANGIPVVSGHRVGDIHAIVNSLGQHVHGALQHSASSNYGTEGELVVTGDGTVDRVNGQAGSETGPGSIANPGGPAYPGYEANASKHTFSQHYLNNPKIQLVAEKGGAPREYADVMTPSLYCPEGFELQGASCVKTAQVGLLKTCPDNYSFDEMDGTCVQIVRSKAVLQCPVGSSLRGNKCEIADVAAPIYKCDAGYNLLNGKCMKYVQAKVNTQCPHGMRLVRGQCVSRATDTAEYACPENFQLKNKRCESWLYEDVHKECPSGFLLIDDMCRQETRTHPSMKCPTGSKLGDGDRCYVEAILKPQYSCGNGTLTSDGHKKTCDYTVTEKPTISCPRGFERHGARCLKIEEVPIELTCPVGFQMQGSDCVRSFQQRADVACPDGTSLRGLNCVYLSAVDQEAACPYKQTMVDGYCLDIQSRKPIELCPKGYRPTLNNECEMHVSVPAEVVCPLAYVNNHGICELLDSAAAVKVCEDGSEPVDGVCRTVDVREIRTDCPSGYQVAKEGTHAGQCIRLKLSTPNFICEEGLIYNDECHTDRRIEAGVGCPRGFTAVDGSCSKSDVVEAKVECPKRYKYKNGVCMKMM